MLKSDFPPAPGAGVKNEPYPMKSVEILLV